MSNLCECGCGNPAPIQPRSYWKYGYIKNQPSRFIRGHATKGKKYPKEVAQRLRKNGEKTQFKKGHRTFPDLVKFIEPYQNGKRHWNWKGGITPEVLKIRHSQKYSNWRRRVFVRDRFVCQFCGKRGGYVEADHVIPFSKLFKEKNWKVMWDTSNGRTLCRPCHDTTKTRST